MVGRSLIILSLRRTLKCVDNSGFSQWPVGSYRLPVHHYENVAVRRKLCWTFRPEGFCSFEPVAHHLAELSMRLYLRPELLTQAAGPEQGDFRTGAPLNCPRAQN